MHGQVVELVVVDWLLQQKLNLMDVCNNGFAHVVCAPTRKGSYGYYPCGKGPTSSHVLLATFDNNLMFIIIMQS